MYLSFFIMDETRNIIDYYHYWTTDAIKADLDTKRNNFSILCANVAGDFNIGTVIRCGNAFLAKEVIIYGRKKFDRRGTVGTHNYENFKHVRTVDELSDLRNNYLKDSVLIGMDNISGAKVINDYQWPNKHFVLCLGEEQLGIPDEIKAICNDFVYIKQYGSVRSLNVGVAAGIAMYDIAGKISNG